MSSPIVFPFRKGVAPGGIAKLTISVDVNLSATSMNKTTPQNRIAGIIKKLKKSGKIIVFTNGCFDILHIGHIRLLKKAKSLGDVLVVGLNSDVSIRQIKGKCRPVVVENERAEILASISAVDLVVKFSQPTPYKLIRRIMPDVLVKGADWQNGKIIGSEFAKKIVRVPIAKGHSTTGIIKKLKNL